MPAHNAKLEQTEYRLVLVRFGSQAIWVDRANGALRLPRVTIPRWTRAAEQLQQVIEASWHLRTIVLEFLPSKMDSAPCAVVEITSSETPDSLAAASIEQIVAEDMVSGEREAVNTILAGNGSASGPFSRIGWIQDAMEWIRAVVGHDIEFTGEVRQLNASGRFALVRFRTQAGPAYWLKATGKPNVHEFHVTRELAELCPEFLPRQIAAREDWNAWLMEEAGEPLNSWTLPELENAVLSMAMLQKKTLGRTKELLAVGAADQRISTLCEGLVELVEYLDEVMAKQTSDRVPRIETRRLWQMATLLQDACSRMEDLNIPDTLVHSDINSGNILFKGRRCVFTDWCEAGVGNPFLTFQYLCLLQARGQESWNSRLRELYSRAWRDIISAAHIEKALVLMPLLAILSYLYGRGTWLRSPRRNDPHFESYARSLARHIDRASQAPALLEALRP
jgi:hypothetical protein